MNQVDVKSTNDKDGTKFEIHVLEIHVKYLKLRIQLLLIVGFIHYMYMLLKEKTTYYLQNWKSYSS